MASKRLKFVQEGDAPIEYLLAEQAPAKYYRNIHVSFCLSSDIDIGSWFAGTGQ
jgi:hypothetical protein